MEAATVDEGAASAEDRRRARRAAFAAEVLELEAVLGLIAPCTSSSLGRRVLAELEPLEDEEARAALERVDEACLLHRAGDLPGLAGVTDPLPRRSARSLDEETLVGLRGFLDAAARLGEWFPARAQDVPRLAEVVAGLPDLTDLARRMDQVLDERGRVRRDASVLLARLSREISELSARIEGRVRELLNRADVRAVLSDGSVHRRGGRPVLAVRAKSSGRVRGIVHDRSQSDQTVFVEPQEVIEPGNRLAGLRADETREVDRILLELSRDVLARSEEIRRAADGVGQVELALACARFCAEQGARRALQPGDEGASEGLLLRSARHPLLIDQERRGQLGHVVPIDLRLGGDFDMLVVTGPNTGGKTLALKTAGLFALLTRLGLPVPCEAGTTVPLYDGVAADIGDEQEISQNLSTFASHLVRIRDGLARATPRTLVLLDELGGGTDPDEGAALGEAVLEELLGRGVPTLASTHISKLKEFAYRHARVENASTEFDLETLEPLYKLHVGLAGESGALVIARRLGLPARVVDAAAGRTERREGELAELMADVQRARREVEEVRARTEAELEEARSRARELEERAREMERRGELLEKEAQRGIEERVRDAMRRLERARQLVQQLPAAVGESMREVLDQLEADLTGATLSDRRQEFLDGLAKGSLVYVPRYRQRLMVHKVDRERREVVVKLGSMKMRVSMDEVTLYESI